MATFQRIAGSPAVVLPSAKVAWAGFQSLGHRPEEMLKALVQLQSAQAPPDQAFPIICATLASAAADMELPAIEELGELGQAVFDYIAQGNETGVSGLFGEEAMASYTARTGGKVPTSQVQKLAEKMISANLIARPGHGIYTVADPFVRKVWMERRRLLLR